jgi:hypothetical protein
VVEDDPPGIDTEVVLVPFWLREKTPLAELEDRVIVSAVVVGLPNWSRSATVTGPRFAVEDALPDTALEVITSLLALAAVTLMLVVPVVLVCVVSLTVSDWLPTVFSVTPLVKLCEPLSADVKV